MSTKSDESIFRKFREEIQRRCGKKFVSKEEEKEEEEGKFISEEEEEEIFEEDELLDDILAEKRRKYSAKDEFVYLLYNDMLPSAVTEWTGRPIKKKRHDIHFEEEAFNESFTDEESTENYEKEEEESFPWRLVLADELVDVTFVNKNSYTGRASRKMMEGDGIYKWVDGTVYQGEFQENQMQGKGLIHWTNGFWYEGNFANNFRESQGTMANAQFDCLYKGSWKAGLKHGKGLCRHEEDFYEGDWVIDKMEGKGSRVYQNGSRYLGQWKNNLRHGIGTMLWPNGDVFRGEWENGTMHGYGEYTWNGFFNKTLTWPQEAFYAGEWNCGMRHGKGLLKLKSSGGAMYFGFWNKNKKDGYGLIIGNDGRVVEKDPLFIMDNVITKENRSVKKKKPRKTSHDILFLPVANPEYCPDLSYYTSRLLENNKELIDVELEECRIYSCIKMHILQLRKVYDIYGKVFSDDPPRCDLAMSHVSLWQLWRDCKIQQKGLGPAEIDNYLSRNKSTFIKPSHPPFEKLEFWQFLHALLEVSWHLYTKSDTFSAGKMGGKLAVGLETFFQEVLFPNAGNHIGEVYRQFRDTLPMQALYKLYKEIGRPVTARKVLRESCLAKNTKPTSLTAPEYFLNGINCVTVGEKLSYIKLKNGEPEDPQHLKKYDIVHGQELLTFKILGPKKILEILTSVCPLIKDSQSDLIVNIDYEITYLEFYEIILEATKKLLENFEERTGRNTTFNIA